MARYASERLAEAMGIIAMQVDNIGISNLFAKVWENSSGHNNQLAMTYLFSDVRTEI